MARHDKEVSEHNDLEDYIRHIRGDVAEDGNEVVNFRTQATPEDNIALSEMQLGCIEANRQLAMHRRACLWEAQLSDQQRITIAANRSRALHRKAEKEQQLTALDTVERSEPPANTCSNSEVSIDGLSEEPILVGRIEVNGNGG